MRSGAGELVTVVIPARNEERFIAECLRSILSQSYESLQVIVVDGASEDRTADIVRAHAKRDPRVELLVNPHRVIPRSLNLAVASARGRWLVRVDAHATVPPDYVTRAVGHLRTGLWWGVGGRKDGFGTTSAGRAVAVAMGSRFGVGNSTYHHGEEVQVVDHVPFGAYPIEVVRSQGGWNEELAVNQDFEFDFRLREAGGRLLFDPQLVIEWRCRQSVPDLYRQYRRYGRGKVKVACLHPTSVRWRHFMAPALVAWSALATVTGLRRPAVALSMLSPYVVALAGATTATARRIDDPVARRWVAPAFLAMHVGWGVGFWTEVFRMLVRWRPGRGAGDAPAPVLAPGQVEHGRFGPDSRAVDVRSEPEADPVIDLRAVEPSRRQLDRSLVDQRQPTGR